MLCVGEKSVLVVLDPQLVVVVDFVVVLHLVEADDFDFGKHVVVAQLVLHYHGFGAILLEKVAQIGNINH